MLELLVERNKTYRFVMIALGGDANPTVGTSGMSFSKAELQKISARDIRDVTVCLITVETFSPVKLR